MTQAHDGDSFGRAPVGTSEQVRKRGIPTLYRDVLFRSRIEARWAAAFDLWGWTWAYEAIDLSGYVPDFILEFDAPILVEVKARPEEYDAAEGKIELSGWRGEAMIVSSVIDGSLVGRFGATEGAPDGTQRAWGDAQIFFCINCQRVSILAAHSSWHCRLCGNGDGNAHVGEHDPGPDLARAANMVQWRAA